MFSASSENSYIDVRGLLICISSWSWKHISAFKIIYLANSKTILPEGSVNIIREHLVATGNAWAYVVSTNVEHQERMLLRDEKVFHASATQQSCPRISACRWEGVSERARSRAVVTSGVQTPVH